MESCDALCFPQTKHFTAVPRVCICVCVCVYVVCVCVCVCVYVVCVRFMYTIWQKTKC